MNEVWIVYVFGCQVDFVKGGVQLFGVVLWILLWSEVWQLCFDFGEVDVVVVFVWFCFGCDVQFGVWYCFGDDFGDVVYVIVVCGVVDVEGFVVYDVLWCFGCSQEGL